MVLAFFAVLSVIFLRHLIPVWGTAIPGGLEDTRLFLWNAWWFRYAIHTLHTSPFYTPMLFHPFGSSLLSHDFPLWTNLITYLGQVAGLGLLAASNVWFILSWALAGYCSYLLAREVTGERAPAVVAGLYVMTHTYTLARAMQNWGQFNLYGIALFLWAWLRARRLGRPSGYVGAGIALAWTAACHYYFLIYSGTIWLAGVLVDIWPWTYRVEQRTPSGALRRALSGTSFFAGLIAGWIHFWHPPTIVIGSLHISMDTPWNALLVMWVGIVGWVVCGWRMHPHPQPLSLRERVAEGQVRVRSELLLVGSALLCLSPLIIAVFKLVLAGGYPRQHILWKTPPMGVDLLGLFMPNPLQAVWGPAVTRWALAQGLYPQEQAAGGIGWVCLGVVVCSGIWKSSAARRWFTLAVGASVLSLGTYLHVWGQNLWLPLPYYVWRLLPVMGNVRLPERWMAVGAIAWSVVLALALIQVAQAKGWRLNRMCLVVGALILLENWPGIPLGSLTADDPVYQALKQAPAGAVLPLPLYIGDSSIGAGDAPGGQTWDTLGAQIHHQHPILGGYIGRISRQMIQNYKADPFLKNVLDLEEAKIPDAVPLRRADACQSMKAYSVSYVLLYPQSLDPRTLRYAKASLPLHLLNKSSLAELYRIDCRP